MSSIVKATSRLALAVIAAIVPVLVHGANAYSARQGEYWVSRSMAGDQMQPQIALNPSGGYIVWQDNNTDGAGLGVSARALNNSFSPVIERTFRVNQTAAGDQERPAVQLLKGGGAVFAWQGGAAGQQDIFLRIISSAGTFATGEIRVNSTTDGQQQDAALAVQSGGDIVVTWSGSGQDGSMQGVFGQRFSAAGVKVGGEFQVNVFTLYNQRSAAAAPLGNGGFVVAWASEQQRFEGSVDVYARLFDAAGQPLTGEVRLNAGTNVCANPVLSSNGDQGFLATWSELDLEHVENAWDVLACAFDLSGVPAAAPTKVNVRQTGKQYAPRVASIGTDHLIVWTSLAQDQSREGVFGRFLVNGALSGSEFLVNTTTMSQQMHPAVAADGAGQFVVAWTGFIGGTASFDLFAQRYSAIEVLAKPAAPFVFALDSYTLAVSWPELAGFNVASYRLYVDGATEPVLATGNYQTLSNLAPGSTHTARLAYELADGRVSPLSDAVTGTTWGRDNNFDGLADDWQTQHWGATTSSWPGPLADSDGDGASNVQEFLAGTNPVDADSVLKVRIEAASGGHRLSWDTQPGSVYQVQSSTDLRTWSVSGSSRFAAEATDSMTIDHSSGATYYRVIRAR